MRALTAVAVMLPALILGRGSSAATYDLASQFGSTNPSGPWSYLYFSSALTNPKLYTSLSSGTLELWEDLTLPQTGTYSTPSVGYNTTSSEQSAGTIVFLPHQATFSPGQNGEVSGYEFIAPTAGTYTLTASFSGRDFVGPTDTKVEILNAGLAPIYSGIVDGYAGDSSRSVVGPSPTVSFTDTLSLSPASPLYFLVAFDPADPRSSGPFFYDTTGISVQIASAAVPEPASLTVLGAGALVAGLIRRHPRRA